MRQMLEPIECDLLKSVRDKRTDIKRDIYKPFLGQYSEPTLARKLNRLISLGYICKNKRYRLARKGSRALERVA